MKILVMPNKLSTLDSFDDSDGFIVGVKDFSWFMPLELTIEQLKELVPKIKKNGKEIFVSLNKLMYNQDIPLLKEYLLVIEELDVNGILYDDIAVLRISKTLSLNTPLMWASAHFFTNSYTANYWHKKGAKGGLLSTEIPLDHIREIKDNTKMLLMMYGYGYLPMFVSARSLISSYFKHINGLKEKEIYHMYEKMRNASYPTYESNGETVILSSEIINTINELPQLNEMIDYLILSSLNISSEKFNNIYQYYIKALNYLDDKHMLDELSDLTSKESPSKTDKGFLYKETIYRVKNDEK